MTTRAVFYFPRGRSRMVAYWMADKAARGKSRASMGYPAIAARYPSQPDVVRHPAGAVPL
jgi:hypothetical protein